jgi:hypothetical protein
MPVSYSQQVRFLIPNLWMPDAIPLLSWVWKYHRLYDHRSSNVHCSFYFVSVIQLVILQCSRCTSSLPETNRATNGHRFVFQSSEVLGTERHYIPHEKGILSFTTGILSSGQPHIYRTPPQLNLFHSDNQGYRADSYGQTSPIDSPSSTAPALELTNIHDYSQQFEQDSWTVSCTLNWILYISPF